MRLFLNGVVDLSDDEVMIMDDRETETREKTNEARPSFVPRDIRELFSEIEGLCAILEMIGDLGFTVIRRFLSFANFKLFHLFDFYTFLRFFGLAFYCFSEKTGI